MKNNLKIITIISLLLLSLFLTFYFQFVAASPVLVTPLFFLPAVIAAIWWKRAGIYIALFLGAALLLAQYFSGSGIVPMDALLAAMLIFVTVTVSFISNKNKKYLLKIAETERLLAATGKLISQTEEMALANKKLQMLNEEIKAQNKELQKLITDKNRFMSVLAHDLRSPFSSILLFTGFMAKNLRDLDIDKIEDFIIRIDRSAQNIYNLLDDLLSWAGSQMGVITYDPRKINLLYITNEVIEILTLSAINKNIVITNLVQEEITVLADYNMLKTVLRNLVSNAIKFTYNGGQIKIDAINVQNTVNIIVSDNGKGIAPELLSKLLDVAHLVTTKGTAGEKGSGVGLLLCKEFVEKNGGTIWIESEEGKGSDFKFTIPKYTEP